MIRIVLALGAVALVIVSGLAIRGRSMLEPAAATAAPRDFVIERGATLNGVARRLEGEGLVKSALATKLAARWQGIESKLQVGEYELSPHLAPAEILEILSSGRVKTYSVTVPEGHRATEIAAILERAGLVDAEAFLAVVLDAEFAHSLGIEQDSLEGYLYPDTYQLPKNMGEKEVARTMVKLFDSVWQSQIAALAEGHALDRPEIVTLASIVEKETAAPEERPLIAAVFLNRLDRGMRLETDPTVIYGIPDFDGNIKKRHLLDGSNPYNTYRIRGLPPGPIASPGAEALRAVVQPAETDYLYFVSQNDGTHFFSSNYRDHVNAVNRYQKRRRSR
jgi:UPF0755 protein